MISTKGRYALRVMIDIAEHNDEGYIPLKEIAARQEVSKKYLEIITKELVKGDFLTGVSGKGGGYRLCRAPKDYNVGEIIEYMEGSLAAVSCLVKDTKECQRAQQCKTLPMWAEFNSMVHEFFYNKKLTDFLD